MGKLVSFCCGAATLALTILFTKHITVDDYDTYCRIRDRVDDIEDDETSSYDFKLNRLYNDLNNTAIYGASSMLFRQKYCQLNQKIAALIDKYDENNINSADITAAYKEFSSNLDKGSKSDAFDDISAIVSSDNKKSDENDEEDDIFGLEDGPDTDITTQKEGNCDK